MKIASSRITNDGSLSTTESEGKKEGRWLYIYRKGEREHETSGLALTDTDAG